VLLIATDRGVERVACACEVAHAAGVRVEMTVAHARSLLAGRAVRVAPHKPDDDARALDRMVQWAFRFSPVVSADYPDGMLLDISGCAHLHAGEERLAKKIVWSLEQWRFPARVCVGPTVAVARAVARHTRERITVIPDHAAGDELRFLPVSALGLEPGIRHALAEVGVVNVDQLLNLPREDLAPRFGSELLRKIDQALGLAQELIEPVKPIEPMVLTRTFEGAVNNQEAIFLAVEQLLREVVGKLERGESGLSRMSIKLRHVGTKARRHEESGNEATRQRGNQNECQITTLPNYYITKSGQDISLSLSFPSRDFAHLWALLRPKLERVHLGYGVEEIVLHVQHLQRLSHSQMELWPDAASATHVDDHAIMGQWLDQVIERLGRHTVVEMQPAERYLPERAFIPQAMQHADTNSSSHSEGEGRGKGKRRNSKCEMRNAKKAIYPAFRPSKLFSPPEHARVIALVPDSPPAWILWQGQEMNVVSGYGPERISAPWWDGRSGHEGTEMRATKAGVRTRHEGETRDYFVIQTEGGIWLWVYRECLTAEWFVHGEWA
jgi:protein ImuB